MQLEINFPALALSLAITLLAYSAFPILFALLKRKSITSGKYKFFCYAINFVVMCMFVGINTNSGTSPGVSGGPYLIWTSVFCALGMFILDKKNLIS